jgi:murein DD-endopeptidase MepM/ murein hydrolase activator NlpD
MEHITDMLRKAPITTTASGTVIRTGYTAGNGNYVKVKHNNTYSTQYHMSKSWFDVVNM